MSRRKSTSSTTSTSTTPNGNKGDATMNTQDVTEVIETTTEIAVVPNGWESIEPSITDTFVDEAVLEIVTMREDLVAAYAKIEKLEAEVTDLQMRNLDLIANALEQARAEVRQRSAEWMTFKEAADYLGVRYQQVFQRAERGKLQTSDLYGKKMVSKKSVLEWEVIRREWKEKQEFDK